MRKVAKAVMVRKLSCRDSLVVWHDPRSSALMSEPGRFEGVMPISAMIFGDASASGAAFQAALSKVRFGRAAPDGPAGCAAWLLMRWPGSPGALLACRWRRAVRASLRSDVMMVARSTLATGGCSLLPPVPPPVRVVMLARSRFRSRF
jgi:hypothetical protein